MGKYQDLTPEIKSLIKNGLSNVDIVKVLIARHPDKKIGLKNGSTEIGKIVKQLKPIIQKENAEDTSETHTNQYNISNFKLSAVKLDGTIMNLKEYCNHYGLNHKDYRSAKICTHAGGATYNLASKSFDDAVDVINIKKFKKRLKKLLLDEHIVTDKPNVSYLRDKEAAIKLADLHFGALVKSLLKTKDFNSTILYELLNDTANIINEFGFKKVHIHLLGDLIESFTGLNHINSFKSLNSAEVGANAIKGCTLLLDQFFKKINNLGEIKIVAGNHDRTSSNNKEDVEGDAANLIAWGLGLLGYSVEFHPVVITHIVEGICHILTHGHHGISKMSTKDICFDYGKQGMFNLIFEGHLHSAIEKLSISQQKAFKTIKDDAVDHRRCWATSFFTGNLFSEQLGYTSSSGFVITFNNGKGIPHVMYMAV